MYVCICNAVTDHQIQELVAQGAQSLSELKDQLGIASCCGCCADLASSFLTTHANNGATNIAASVAKI